MSIDKETHPGYQYLQQLDLTYIENTMCSEQYILPQWAREDAQTAIKLYKRFLWLIIKYGKDQQIVPTKEIDEVWHNHILHTKAYMTDCQTIAGQTIHHQPSDLSTEDTTQLANNFTITRDLYLQEFGEPLPYYLQD